MLNWKGFHTYGDTVITVKLAKCRACLRSYRSKINLLFQGGTTNKKGVG